MSRIVLVAAVAALSLPALASASEVKSIGNARVTPISNTVVGTDKNGKICKTILRTGSRLGENKICKTKEEWDVITQDARKATEKKQIFTFKNAE